MSESDRRRDQYLLDGRRVRVKDLVTAGLLEVGSQLTFVRPRLGKRYSAAVDIDGHIVLADNGGSFASPSKAASRAAGGGSFDGWLAWQTVDGDLLDALRQQLLDTALPQAAVDRPQEETARDLHRFLREAAAVSESNEPLRLEVRELLRHFGVLSRDSSETERVNAALQNYRLITEPDYAKVGLNSLVTLRTPTDPRGNDDVDADESVADVEDDEEQIMSVGLTLGNIESATRGITRVSPNATFDEAITLMVLNDYSQLAVMEGDRKLAGAVTWQSIAQTQHADPDAPFTAAIVKAAPLPFDTELVDVLTTLQTHGFVFVYDEVNRISGIVTTADVVGEYGELATPFFLIGELDHQLRRLIKATFELPRVQAVCDPETQRHDLGYDDLTMGDYEAVLSNQDCWTQLGWPLSRKAFSSRLGELRSARNSIMHFNPDGIDESVVPKIRHLLTVLRRYSKDQLD